MLLSATAWICRPLTTPSPTAAPLPLRHHAIATRTPKAPSGAFAEQTSRTANDRHTPAHCSMVSIVSSRYREAALGLLVEFSDALGGFDQSARQPLELRRYEVRGQADIGSFAALLWPP